MQSSKSISVNASSLVDLKAELLKKQEEFKKSKLYNDLRVTAHRPKKKLTVWDVKNNGVSSRSAKDLEVIEREENSLSKSRCALEAKALLYEKLKNGTSNIGDEEKSLFLVNFDQKTKECVGENELESKKSFEVGEIIAGGTEDFPPNSREEEWVDYIDQFGRSRTCMRKNLPENTTLDPDSENNKKLDPMQALLLSEDMRREHQRQLWEEEEREAMKNPIKDTHYQNVLFNEVRSHGVGYYGFSKDEEERTKQEDMLNDMRNQTVKNRKAREKLLEKRKAKMSERLAKVQQRKKLKIEEPQEPIVETEKSKIEISLEIEKKLVEIEAEHSRKQHIRPWDRNKNPSSSVEFIPKLSQADWISQKREERNMEFAPPTVANYKDYCVSKNNLKNNNQSSNAGTTFPSEKPSQSNSTVFYQDFSLDNIPLPETRSPANLDVEEATDENILPEVDINIENSIESLPQKTFCENIDTSSQNCHGSDFKQFQDILSQQLSYFKNKT